jgi:ribokinase
MNKTITVIGSSNTDMVVKAARLPAPGETILGGTFGMFPGGKGANQAVAAARLGGTVSFVGKRGADIFGTEAASLLAKEGINTAHFSVHPHLPSGVALITIDEEAENCIVVASGANAALLPEEVTEAADVIAQSSIVLLQLETPLTTIEYAVNIAAQKGVTVILNPAPAQALSSSLLKNVSIITPNETEAEILTGVHINGIEAAKAAALALNEKGVQSVIITLGADGALIYHQARFTKIDGVPVKAIDTTAAGDVFNGALAVGLAEGQPIEEAARYACRAAAISVTRMGAQSSAPTKQEVNAYVHH